MKAGNLFLAALFVGSSSTSMKRAVSFGERGGIHKATRPRPIRAIHVERERDPRKPLPSRMRM